MSNIWNKARTCLLHVFGVFIVVSTAFGQTWTVSSSPQALTIYPGQQNIQLSVTLGSSTYAGPIDITLSGLPSGITVSPLTLTSGSTGTLYLNASVAAGNEGFYNNSKPAWTAQVTIVAAAGATQATSQLPLTISISNPSYAPAAANINLPIVKIDTNGVRIVSKTVDVPGTITITSADGQTTYLPNASDTDNTATFHVHGNSTAHMPKLPYHVKLNTSLDLLNTMGVSCPYVTSGKAKPTCDKSKSYILLANYDDKTFLRDWAASALANAIPIGNGYLSSPTDSPSPSGTSMLMPWAPHSLFVELYLNGQYEGNYQLIEEVKVDSHRVNIQELAETDINDDITGGYLMEIDVHKDEAYVFTTPKGLPIGLIDPDFSPDPEVPEQTTYITNYVDTAETALFSSNFTDPTLGWRAYFDEASAVNFYIVNDLMGNSDGGHLVSSDYLYKNIDNPLLYLGPIWDFDISSGNVNYDAIVNPTVPWTQQATWYRRWFADPGFKADVATQWNALKNNGVLSSWLASIQAQAATLQQSQVNNFGRWPMQGVEVAPNPEAAGSYNGEVQYLVNWLQLRMAYLDSLFNNKAQTSTSLQIGGGTLRSGSPITLTAQVTGGTSPTGTVSFLSSGVLVGTGPLSDTTATLTTSSLPAGTDSLEAVYSGDSKNGLSASTTQSVTIASPLDSTIVSLSIPATAVAGVSASFAASVIPNAGTAAPTGTITFNVDGGSGTTVELNGSGVASYAATFLIAGTHAVNAIYSGDNNYSGATGSVSVAVANPDFNFVSTGTATQTVIPGSSARYSFAVTPDSTSYASTIDFSATGLPAGAAAEFSPLSISTAGGAQTATMTVQTAAATAQKGDPAIGRKLASVAFALLLLPLIGAGTMRRQGRRMGGLLCLLILLSGLAAAVGLSGCGSGYFSQAPRSYTVSVTATNGILTHQCNVTLNVR